MGRLQEAFDNALRNRFSVEMVISRHVTRELERRGVKLGEAQRKKLRKALGNLRRTGSITIDLTNENQDALRAFYGESGDGIVIESDLDYLGEEISAAIQEVVPGVIEESAELMLKSIRRQTRRQLASRRKVQRGFERRLRREWGKGLNLLDVHRAICLEAGSDANEELGSEPEFEKDPVLFVLVRLHAHACQVASEIATLLRSGHADGAHARWRTLHEIAVIGRFIREHGAEVAEGYILHDAIEAEKAARMYQEKAARLGVEPLTAREMNAVERRADELIDRFGKAYGGDYGWAAITLGTQRPTFRDIERNTGLDHIRPHYRLASDNIHGNPKGTFYSLGLLDEGSVLLAGPSNAGLVQPAHSTAISLSLITISLLTLEPNIDRLVACRILLRLQDEIGDELITTHDAMLGDRTKSLTDEWN